MNLSYGNYEYWQISIYLYLTKEIYLPNMVNLSEIQRYYSK